jgi:ATP-dependent Clp protease ATP-binding subunit ClpA
MAHVTKLLPHNILSNGQIEIRVQCCGHERHISGRTLATSVAADPEKLQKAEDELREQVAGEHAAEMAADKLLKARIGVEKKH